MPAPSVRSLRVLEAAVPPAVTDDGASGFAVLDRWIDTATGAIYECHDTTAGAAVWARVAPLPAALGTAGQVLTVTAGGDGLEWKTPV